MKRAALISLSVGVFGICLVAFQNCGRSSSSEASTSNNAASTAVNCQSGSSVTCPIANGIGTYLCGSAISSCSPTSCNSGFVVNGYACVTATCSPSAIQPCTLLNGTGIQTCSAQSVWGSCQLTNCNSGFTLSGGVCIQNQKTCSLTTQGNVSFSNAPASTYSETSTSSINACIQFCQGLNAAACAFRGGVNCVAFFTTSVIGGVFPDTNGSFFGYCN